MKRKADFSDSRPKARRKPVPVLDYCDVEVKRAEDGSEIWPAAEKDIDRARAYIRECAENRRRTLIVPDKDADGLSSGVIVYRTLEALGLDCTLIDVHLISKGTTIHTESERQAMQEKRPERVIVLDQGSRKGPRIIDSEDTTCLVIDHHNATSSDCPDGAEFVSACAYPPVATSSLLTYIICSPLHPSVPTSTSYLCAIGTHGDLGTTLKWKPPFPDMSATFKEHSKKAVNDAVSLINAPRRTAIFDTVSAWTALLSTRNPKDILKNPRLLAARQEINAEVERHTHTPPKFSKDGRIAVLRISSAAQIHPVIATRWAGFLSSKSLEIVCVANNGHLPGMVNFSCRIAKCARDRDPPVNIIETLKEVASRSETDLVARMGDDFARGHKEASGGIVPTAEFEELMALMKIGEKPDPPEGEVAKQANGRGLGKGSPQKNTMLNYFAKA